MPEWMATMIAELEQRIYSAREVSEHLSTVAEEARRLCVPAQQYLAKLEEALVDLRHASRWIKPEDNYEVPL